MQDSDHYARTRYVPLHHKASIVFDFDQGLTYST